MKTKNEILIAKILSRLLTFFNKNHIYFKKVFNQYKDLRWILICIYFDIKAISSIPKSKYTIASIKNNTKIVTLPIPKPKIKKFNVQKLSTSFSIPLNGDVINKFGSNSDGIISEGINIEAKYGETVKASANGEVIFVGSDLKDFGTMMLIKHNDKLITCYAHLSKIYVNEGDFIIQGQTIVEVGSTGKVSKPQLYFEIRKNNEPINPEDYINI